MRTCFKKDFQGHFDNSNVPPKPNTQPGETENRPSNIKHSQTGAGSHSKDAEQSRYSNKDKSERRARDRVREDSSSDETEKYKNTGNQNAFHIGFFKGEQDQSQEVTFKKEIKYSRVVGRGEARNNQIPPEKKQEVEIGPNSNEKEKQKEKQEDIKGGKKEKPKRLARKKKEETEEKGEKEGEKAKEGDPEQEGDLGQSYVRKQMKSRKKRIMKPQKTENFVRLDLKRKYEEKFRGGLARNKKRFTKNGRLKDKYKKSSLEEEFEITGDGIYNTFVHSLSSALTVNLYEDDDYEKEAELVDIKQFGRSKEEQTELIRKVFGYEEFRFGQYEVVMDILNYKSTLFISETGSGKSLTYILGSLLSTGIAIVICPLISLMLDQIMKLPKELPGVCIHSHLTFDQKQRMINMIIAGKVKIVYMTPEALETELAYKMRSFPPISFVCIDQAHCISQLSHNFRTSYLSIHELIKCNFRFQRNYCVLALTASANEVTAKSIMNKLQIENYVRSSTLQRSNLSLTASRDRGEKRYSAIVQYIKSKPIKKLRGILIYCRTYAKVKEVYNFLNNSGISCAQFFGQLSQKEKTTILQDFREGKTRVIASTVALGMGLDFANLDSVIHLCIPSSIENYVQQIGRAGRRGFKAHCHLFLDEEDYQRERGRILMEKNDEEDMNALFREIKRQTFRESGSFEKRKERDEMIKLSMEQLMAIEDSDNEEIFQEPVEGKEGEKAVEKQKPALLGPFLGKICSINCKELSQTLDVKQQSIITILLKIQNLTDSQLLKVLAPSYQSLEITFNKDNLKLIKAESMLFSQIEEVSKHMNGKIFIKFIDICNLLGRIPSDLLGELQALADKYYLRIEKRGNIFVWEYRGEVTFDEFQKEFGKGLVAEMKEVQDIQLLKLNIIYTVMYQNSSFDIAKWMENEVVEKRHRTGIEESLDKYFMTPFKEFYDQVREGEHYIPVYNLEESKVQLFKDLAIRFLNHEGINSIESMKKYLNGRIVTNILMGISTPSFDEKKYGQEPYFGEFRNVDYQQVMGRAKKVCEEFLQGFILDE